MGPVLCEVFAEQGASVIASKQSLLDPHEPAAVVSVAGLIDVLVVNPAVPASSTAAMEVTETEWRDTFASLVDPLSRLFRAVLAQMIERRSGKMLVMGSAAALRGMKRASQSG
jgi:2-keto-3-deoxy-L-fuconate dehydrogenase